MNELAAAEQIKDGMKAVALALEKGFNRIADSIAELVDARADELNFLIKRDARLPEKLELDNELLRWRIREEKLHQALREKFGIQVRDPNHAWGNVTVHHETLEPLPKPEKSVLPSPQDLPPNQDGPCSGQS